MVGRFVQNQKVHFGEHQFCKRQPRALAARENRNFLEYVLACKAEERQGLTDLRFGSRGVGVPEFVQYRVFGGQVLIFLIARHMIVQTTTPLEDLLSVVSIGILFFFRRFMLMTKPDKDQHVPKLFGVIKASQSSGTAQAEHVDAEKDAEGSTGGGEK